MAKNENRMDYKVKTYVENLFSGVGVSQQLFDLKEELVTNMKEKIADYKSRGMDDEQAFKEAIISMGDLSELVNDMRKLGQDTAKQAVYSTMSARISTAGLIAGVLLVLFGIFTSAIVYFMEFSSLNSTGSLIFVVAGGALFTYSLLTRETSKRYGMNKIRAALYAFSIGLLLFGLFVSAMTHFAVGETYVSISSLMVFLLPAVGLFMYLFLTGTDRRK